MVGNNWRKKSIRLAAPFMLAVLQNMVDDGVISEHEEDVDANRARYPKWIPIEHHLSPSALCSPRLLQCDVVNYSHVLIAFNHVTIIVMVTNFYSTKLAVVLQSHEKRTAATPKTFFIAAKNGEQVALLAKKKMQLSLARLQAA